MRVLWVCIVSLVCLLSACKPTNRSMENEAEAALLQLMQFLETDTFSIRTIDWWVVPGMRDKQEIYTLYIVYHLDSPDVTPVENFLFATRYSFSANPYSIVTAALDADHYAMLMTYHQMDQHPNGTYDQRTIDRLYTKAQTAYQAFD